MDYKTHIFPNGLKLLVVPTKNTNTATVLVMVGTGSKYETKDKNGISHFLEHMTFKGTEKRPGVLEISLELDSIGAEYNAFTGKEYTGYYAKSAAENMDIIMDVISDTFLNSKFDSQEIEKEKGVIIEEINMYYDLPMRYVEELFEKLLYGDQPAGWQIAGEKNIITKFTQNDLREYFNSHYVATDTIVSVAGDVDFEDVKKKIEKYFVNVRQGNKLEKQKVKETQSQPQKLIFYKDTDQTHFIVGFRTFDFFNEKTAALQVLSSILNGGFSSRLWTEVREKQGLAYYVRTSADGYTDSGYIATSAGVDNKRVIQAIKIILDEYRKIKENLIDEKELEKAKKYIKGKTLISLEQSDSLAEFYTEQWLLKNETLTPEEKLAKIDKVTAKDIQDLANEVLRPENLNLSLVGPFKDEKEFEDVLNF